MQRFEDPDFAFNGTYEKLCREIEQSIKDELSMCWFRSNTNDGIAFPAAVCPDYIVGHY